MAFKIYTKKGDHGMTSLIGGQKISKAEIQVDAYGSLDELNAHIGLITDILKDPEIKVSLRRQQSLLFTIGSILACTSGKAIPDYIPQIHQKDISVLETEIDRMETSLPQMTHFILPGGAPEVSYIHIARTVCRRSERQCIRYLSTLDNVPSALIIPYLNRLSDFLFVLARYTAASLGIEEIKWIPDSE